MKKVRFILIMFLSFMSITTYSQSEGDKVKKVIVGEWLIERRNPAVNENNPEIKVDITKIAINKNDTLITFLENGTCFFNEKSETVSYYIKGNSIYINNNRYNCGYYTDNKFCLNFKLHVNQEMIPY